MDHLHQLQMEVNELIEFEDLKWRQRVKQEWLQNGDKNSKFFHASVNHCRKSNFISKIIDIDGDFIRMRLLWNVPLCLITSHFFKLTDLKVWNRVSRVLNKLLHLP